MSDASPSQSSEPEPSGEQNTYVSTLSDHVTSLQRENIAIGNQNQKLAAGLRDASEYNQILGYILYQLDQQIGDLEARIAQSQARIREVDMQTKKMTKEADSCKNALIKDPEFTKLAKRLRRMQKTHTSATTNADELRALLDDERFGVLDGSLQSMQKKVSLLYWSNTELHQQIELMHELMKEGQDNAALRGELDKMKGISDLKNEWLQMRLYEERMRKGKEPAEEDEPEEESKSGEKASLEDARFVVSPLPVSDSARSKKKWGEMTEEEKMQAREKVRKKNDIDDDGFVADLDEETGEKIRVRKIIGDDGRVYEEIKKKDGTIERRVVDMGSTSQKTEPESMLSKSETSEKLVSDKSASSSKRRHRKSETGDMSSSHSKKRKDKSESEARGVSSSHSKKRKEKSETGDMSSSHSKKRKDKSESEARGASSEKKKEESEKYYSDDVVLSKSQKLKAAKKESSDYDDLYDEDSELGKETREKNEDGHSIKRKRVKAKGSDGKYHLYDYEYDYDDLDEATGKPKKTRTRVPADDKGRKKISPADIGYRPTTDPKTGRDVKVRMTVDEDGNKFEYMKVQGDESDKPKTTRRQLNDDGNGYKHYPRPVPGTDKVNSVRTAAVFHGDDAYEYEYEYDSEASKPKRTRLPAPDADGFFETRDPKTGEPVKMRLVQGAANDTYMDIMKPDPVTGKEKVTRTVVNPRTKQPRHRNCDTKAGKANGRRNRVRNDEGEEYEYEYEYDPERNRLGKKRIEDTDDQILEPIVIASKPRRPEDRFVETVDPETGEKVMKRTVKGKDGKTYEDSRQPGRKRTTRKEVGPDGKISQSGTARVRNSDDEEYEYDFHIDEEKNEKVKTKNNSEASEKLEEIGDSDPSGFEEQPDKDGGEPKRIRTVASKVGDLYQDTEEVTSDGRKKIKRRITAKDGDDNYRGEIMTDPEGKKIRRRHTRVRNADDEEYEYQYDYDEDSLDSEGNPKVTRTKTQVSSEIEPIYKKLSQGKKKIHDEQDKPEKQFTEEIHPVTGEKVTAEVANDTNHEVVLNSKGKPMKLKAEQTAGGSKEKYDVVVDPKAGTRAVRRRKVKMINNNEMALEYDDSDIDSETGKPRRRVKQLVMDDKMKPDSNGFYFKIDPETGELMKLRHVQGTDGVYEDTMRVDPREEKVEIARRKLGDEYETKEGDDGQPLRTRRTRTRKPSGDQHEYEYEYDDEKDKVKRHPVEDEKLEKIEYTPNPDDEKKFLQKWRNLAGFHEETDSETGAPKLKRKIKGTDGKAYEDTLAIGPDGGHNIRRCRVDKDGKPKYKKTDRGRKRAERVQNDDLDEYEYEYEYAQGSGDEKEERTKAKRSKSNESLLPITVDDKPDSEGFVAEVDPETGEIVKARLVRGKDGTLYKDIKRKDPKTGKERIERRELAKDGRGKACKRKRNPKTGKVFRVRRTRYQNENGDEYEYEYQYDEEEVDEDTGKPKCTKQRIKPRRETIDTIGGPNGFQEVVDPKTGKRKMVRKVVGDDGETYLDEMIKDRDTGETKIKRRKVQNDGQKPAYEEREKDGEKKRVRRSRCHHLDKNGEREYEYEYDEDGNCSRKAVDESEDQIGSIIPGSSRLGIDDAAETQIKRFMGEDGKMYEDVITKDENGKPIHVTRRQVDKNSQGYAYVRKRNPKTGKVLRTRRSRHMDENGNQYEYEYQYDDEEIDPETKAPECKRRKILPQKHSVPDIAELVAPKTGGLLDVDETTFTEQVDPETGEKMLVRRVKGDDGKIYEDVLEVDPETNRKRVARRLIGDDGKSFAYVEKEKPDGSKVMARRSRYRNQDGEEYEYDYEYDDEAEDGCTRQMVTNQGEEQIEPISKMPNRMKPRSSVAGSKPPAGRTKSRNIVASVPGKGHDWSSEGGEKPAGQGAAAGKRKGVVDLSEFENAATSLIDPVSGLLPKLRAEQEMGSAEELLEILRQLEIEIEERTAVREDLKVQIRELTRPAGNRRRKRYEFSGVRTLNVKVQTDSARVLALNDFNRRSVASQTDCTNDMIMYQMHVLEQQKVERKAAEDLESSLARIKQKIAVTKEMIEDAKRDADAKEEKLHKLQVQMGSAQGELGKEDDHALREEAKTREFAQELDRVDQQVRTKQQQLEKVNSQVGALQMHLKEMQKFRILLENELDDIHKRERPEVRQLVEDVKTYRNAIDETAKAVAEMQKVVDQKREQVEKLENGGDLKRYNDLKLQKANLERRIKKWTGLIKEAKENRGAVEAFSTANATRRRDLAESLKSKQRMILEKEVEIDQLERYAALLQSMIAEHQRNWS